MTPALVALVAELGVDLSIASCRHGVRMRVSHGGESLVDVRVRRSEDYDALEAEDACADAALVAMGRLLARAECTAQARSMHLRRPS